jgi:hypothetical protein
MMKAMLINDQRTLLLDIAQPGRYVIPYTVTIKKVGVWMVLRNFIFKVLLAPGEVIRELAREDSHLAARLQYCLALLFLLPPIFSGIGGVLFGWRLGTPEPLLLSVEQSIIISFLYFLAICFGFFSTVFIARWMGSTYGATAPLSVYLAFFTVVCAPLAVASAAHLFPHVFFNVLVLIPTMIWCMALLYRGLPVALQIPPERGMLMSSALVAWLLVAAVSLLGLSMGLWTVGIGPAIRI